MADQSTNHLPQPLSVNLVGEVEGDGEEDEGDEDGEEELPVQDNLQNY